MAEKERQSAFPVLLHVGVRGGADIRDALRDMAALSLKLDVPVEADFAGISVRIDATELLREAERKWRRERDAAAAGTESTGPR